LGLLLISLYSLTYSGTFTTDDEHILASRALSLAFDGSMNDDRVFGNNRVYALSTLPGEGATQATNIEPGQIVLGAGLARLSLFLGAGRVQTMFLLNIWITALTGILVFLSVRASGCSPNTALLTALLFGVSTQAWPYSKAYFRDSLAAFFLTFAWLCAIIISTPARTSRKTWLGLLLGLILGILTKNTITLAIPAIAILFFQRLSRVGLKSAVVTKNNRRTFVILLILGVILITGWLVLIPRLEYLARFSPEYYLSLLRHFFTTPHPSLVPALAGPFASPGKSIFVYSPVLLLAALALFKDRRLAIPAWLYLIFLVFGQALFYDADWWGHVNWGLRFILPALPILMIAAAPVIEAWLRSTMGRVALLFLAIVSVSVQLVGVLAPVRDYYVKLIQTAPDAPATLGIWNLSSSALAWHFEYIFSGGKWDLAAVRVGSGAIPVIAGFILVLGLSCVGLKRGARLWPTIIGVTLVIGLTFAMLRVYAHDPAYYPFRNDLLAAQTKIEQSEAEGDIVVLKSYGTPVWYYWMNWGVESPHWISLPYYFPTHEALSQFNETRETESELDTVSLTLLTSAVSNYKRVWMLSSSDSPDSGLGLELRWLDLKARLINEQVFEDDAYITHLYLYEVEDLPQ